MHEKRTLRFEIVVFQLWDRAIYMVSIDDLAWTYCIHHGGLCRKTQNATTEHS